MSKAKLIRITTVPESLGLFKGQPKFMSAYYEIIGVSSPGEKVNEVEETEGILVHTIPMTRTISPFKDLISLWRLYEFLIKEKPLIVHSHTPKAGTIAMIASKLAGVPHRLHTVAGLPLITTTGAKRKLLNTVEKITYACATKIYPNSYGLMNFIIKNKFAKESKVKVLGNGSSNGIDITFFNTNQVNKEQCQLLKKELQIKDTEFIYIFIGRLVTDKGINELVSAFEKVNKVFKNTKLLLLGYPEKELDPLKPETELLIERNASILALGFKNDVRPYLAIADVFTFPSYREGFPNVVMQAGAMGLPSIVTNINGSNEIIEDEVNGVIIPVKDSRALETNMRLLMENSKLRDKLKSNARKMIVSRYSQQELWLEILKEYQSLEQNV
jgi:glycosyltransferase involved in cell wall biosynthesis